MAFLLHVEFDANSEAKANGMLQCLAGMANIVRRDHPEVYTYLFRRDNESKTKLVFTEIYGTEQVFLDHAKDPEFTKLYQQAFDPSSGQSRKELCLRNDLSQALMPITASILDHYLHVTYVQIQQGFLHRIPTDKGDGDLLIVCSGCDKNAYELFNELFTCATCVTFEESDESRQLIAIITKFSSEKKAILDTKPTINVVELVCENEETVEKFKNIVQQYFQVQSLHAQTIYSGYIHHRPL
ncbi:unnamed protein product [Adineta ricciae]|uniref:ABM domain-containing protein n=1 Tax=Adineta ricciae TaxID=249248 RepID=A0A814G7X1_ADIRI|nr:unnamed protein product [Adineta ricciae]